MNDAADISLTDFAEAAAQLGKAQGTRFPNVQERAAFCFNSFAQSFVEKQYKRNFCIRFFNCAALAQIGNEVELGAHDVQQILRLLAVQKRFSNGVWLGFGNEADKTLECNRRFCKISSGNFDAKYALRCLETEIAALVSFAFFGDYGSPIVVRVIRNAFGFCLEEHV